jgi:hypothetical protein
MLSASGVAWAEEGELPKLRPIPAVMGPVCTAYLEQVVSFCEAHRESEELRELCAEQLRNHNETLQMIEELGIGDLEAMEEACASAKEAFGVLEN